MSTATDFKTLLDNIKIDNAGQISKRYGRITKALNQYFYNLDSKTANSLQVGSYGRFTGIRGISDLDMLYFLPATAWPRFRDRQSYLLQVVKTEIKKTFKNTDIRGDGQVVVVKFKNQEVEVVPVFSNEDGTFTYPDTHDGGSWKVCNPRAEMSSFRALNDDRKGHLRRLSKMIRAWKARHEVEISGFLIDTLCYNFFSNLTEYDDKSFKSYDQLSLDFFTFLENEGDRVFYYAPGSRSKVSVKKSFNKVAKLTKEYCEEALSATSENSRNLAWKKVFGRPFPNYTTKALSNVNVSEQFIEDQYEMNLYGHVSIECEIRKNNLLEALLSNLLGEGHDISTNRKLRFYVDEINNISHPYKIKWKIKNVGDEAERRGNVRGEILDDEGGSERFETADFSGPHFVECYVIYGNQVV
ncbi:nucleotidyltransferase, partial [Salmonella enterica subsp. enterica serovar Derby]|nr:nucleotidyltransferase [Salmonella enterica subsp. enterica serovar Enteritidis]ECV4668473.1 nucleotidyltransferase [Salmonella enterica subsp. enterica serovar Derby]EDN6680645.1 nucleotidyltransferase [Salmonella enterica]EDE5520753.1 nucleotidyltransferase [Salmonella enterica subsp. enterica serovar Enteritidis]EDZ3723261.1 nucleotidyltransferase [Salmonella enterica]